jgi:hypothetical protein
MTSELDIYRTANILVKEYGLEPRRYIGVWER